MKNSKPKLKKVVLQKVRYKNGTDMFYTYSHWTPKEIEGVQYLPVVKEEPHQDKQQVIHYVRKDAMEYIK